MEIQRHNIFDLIGGRQNIYHSAILTGYTFDPIFFESFYLPKLRQCGISNVVALLDASNYDRMLLQYPSLGIQSDRRLYTLIRQSPTGNGVFHPKLTMLFGEDAGMLVVGSGNLTYNGYSLNEEIWNTFSLKGSDSSYLPLLLTAWRYLKEVVRMDSLLLNQQLRWIVKNTGWLIDYETNRADGVAVDTMHYRFLANDSDGSILEKLRHIIGNEPVISICTVSPFYDVSGSTVAALHAIFSPEEINCIYTEQGTYPYDLIANKPDWLKLYSWDNVFAYKRSDIHRLHAKIIQFTLPSRTVLMTGSANVTHAAFNGISDEACIAIISESPNDFIKALGINLDRKLAVDYATLATLPKPERNTPDVDPKKISIISAEVVGDTLTVLTDTPTMECARLQILDAKGVEIRDYEIPAGISKLQIMDFTLTDCIVVIIDSLKAEISNRYFVICEDDVARFDPNKCLRKLDSLLESNIDWKENIEGILSYLWFDNSVDVKATSTKSVTASIKSKDDVVSKSVQSEDFDNIRIGSRQAVLSSPDVRIVDYLLSSIEKEQDDSSDNSDELESIQDLDNGDNEYYGADQVIARHKRESTFIDCINNYSGRLRKYYNFRLASLYYEADKFGANIFQKKFSDEAPDINVEEYSRILINIVLMWRELQKGADESHKRIRRDFIENLGKFQLLARKGYTPTHDYAWHKCVEFHKELIIFSFLIIASQEWYGSQAVGVKLLIANLLNSCSKSGNIDVEELQDIFSAKMAESKVTFKPNSVSLIKTTRAEYDIFRRHIDDNTTLREVDPDNPNRNYAYRKSFGFFHVANIEKIGRDNRNNPLYEKTLLHPGFDNIVKEQGSSLIRPLV